MQGNVHVIGSRSVAAHWNPPQHASARGADRDNRLTVRDRIMLHEWADAARRGGVSRIMLEGPEAEDDPDVASDFILIYRGGQEWASWGIAPEAEAFMLWRPSDGVTIGHYRTLRDALQVVHPA